MKINIIDYELSVNDNILEPILSLTESLWLNQYDLSLRNNEFIVCVFLNNG